MTDTPTEALAAYAERVTALAGSPGSTEASYYPAIERLLDTLLRHRRLPFDVRVETSQHRTGQGAGGTDLPDLAFYDGSGDYVAVFGEVKTPAVDLPDLARSTENNDQIGRYLAKTQVVLLSNVRGFGLLAVDPEYDGPDGKPVPPESRNLLDVVELWTSSTALAQGGPILPSAATELAELVETAVTEFAPIAEPESLAKVLARQARRAKADLPEHFSAAVRPLLEDFTKALGLHFEGAEGEEFLRSSLIQTAFYGLFAGWTLWHHSGEPEPFDWKDLGEYLKIPFLGALFYEFRHPHRIKELGLKPHLEQATATLGRVNGERFFGRFVVPRVLSDDGAEPSTATSAILYFYEPFLEAFDPELRKELGVWYTPQEIVYYQVHKVERLLRDELGCPRGFADDRVVVLDPCCGTGAYLLEVLRCVATQLQREGTGKDLASKLLHAFCKRIIGFEILTAPFVIAQLQLYLILSELGVEPDPSHRPAIFLTNALTGWDGPEQLKLQFPELQEEHDAAQRVKREEKIIVILGNPPYNRFAGAPMEEEQDLVDHYKGIRRDAKGKQVGPTDLYRRFGIRKQLLDDLYIRFFRLAEIRIGEEADYGVVSYVSNASYLSGLSHPLMRESLLGSFDHIWIDNLNGDKYRTGKIIPKGLPGEGTSDQSVFTTAQDPRGIQVGTAISTFLKKRPGEDRKDIAQVEYRDFWGMSEAKRQALVDSLELHNLPDEESEPLSERPEGPRPYGSVTPTDRNRWKLLSATANGGYEDWPGLDEVFPARFQGVNPNRGLDGSVVATDERELEARMKDYFSDLSFDQLRTRYPELLKRRARYDPEQVRTTLQEVGFRPDLVVSYALFPIDLRVIYYETEAKLINERRPELWENLNDNTFLVSVPHARRRSEARPLVANCLFDLHIHDRGAVGFPAHVKPEESPKDLFHQPSENDGNPVANLAEPIWTALQTVWHLKGDLKSDEAKVCVRRLLNLTLAVAHAPQYQLDHQVALANDWIHLPIPKNRTTFEKIAATGEQIAALLDPKQDATLILDEILVDDRRTLAVTDVRELDVVKESDLEVTISYFGAAKGGWEEREPDEGEAIDPSWGETTGDLYLNDSVFLRHVPERVWHYQLGGYPVIKKWLGYRDAKRRPGRPLTHEELDHLRSIIHRIAALLRLHPRLDQCYEQAIEDPFTSEELGL